MTRCWKETLLITRSTLSRRSRYCGINSSNIKYLGRKNLRIGSHYAKVEVTEHTAMAEKLVQTFQELQKSFMVDLSSKLEFRQLKCIERQTSKLLRDMDSSLHPVPPITIPISLHEPKIRYGPDLVQIEKNIAASDGEYHPVKHNGLASRSMREYDANHAGSTTSCLVQLIVWTVTNVGLHYEERATLVHGSRRWDSGGDVCGDSRF